MNLSNSTGNETISFPSKQPIPVDVQITLYSVLLIWSLLGNILVIAVVWCNPNMRTNMNYLFVNMAVSDLLVPLVAMPYNISWNLTNGKWLVDGPLGEAFCKLVYYLSDLSPFVSSMSSVIIAFKRYMTIVYPNRRPLLSRRTRWLEFSFPWIVAMALLSPYFYIHRLTEKDGQTICSISWSSTSDQLTANLIYRSTAAVVGFVVPLIATITMYSIIMHKLRKCLNNVKGMMERETIRLRRKRNKRIFSLLISMVVLFTICWCPMFSLFLLEYFVPTFSSMDRSSIYTMHVVFAYMWYLLAAINPCMYFVFLKDFRQGVKSLCRKRASVNEPIPRRYGTPDGDSKQGSTCASQLTSTVPLQSKMNNNTRRPRTPEGDSNQDPACTPPHINTTSV